MSRILSEIIDFKPGSREGRRSSLLGARPRSLTWPTLVLPGLLKMTRKGTRVPPILRVVLLSLQTGGTKTATACPGDAGAPEARC